MGRVVEEGLEKVQLRVGDDVVSGRRHQGQENYYIVIRVEQDGRVEPQVRHREQVPVWASFDCNMEISVKDIT
jgi:hypothetical protein